MIGVEIVFIVPDSLEALAAYESVFEVQRLEVTAFAKGNNEAVFSIYGTRFHMLDESPKFQLFAPKPGDPKLVSFNVMVPDIAKAYEAALSAGFSAMEEIAELPAFGVSRCMLTDPYGYVWLVHQVHREVSFEERVRIMEALRETRGVVENASGPSHAQHSLEEVTVLKERRILIGALVASYFLSLFARESMRGSFLVVISDCVALFGTLILLADLGATTMQASAAVPALSYPGWAIRLHEFVVKTVPATVFVFMVCFGLYRLLTLGLILGALLMAPYGVAWAGGQAIFRLAFGAGLRLNVKPRLALTTAALTLGLVDVAGGIPLAQLWRDEPWNLPLYAVLAFLTLMYSIAAMSRSQATHDDSADQT